MRLETALHDLYGDYERLEPLLENVQRDAPVMPIVAEMNAYRARYLEDIRDLLLEAWTTPGGARPRLRRAIGHALGFRTRQSLVRRQGCRNHEAAQLMVTLRVRGRVRRGRRAERGRLLTGTAMGVWLVPGSGSRRLHDVDSVGACDAAPRAEARDARDGRGRRSRQRG